MKNLSFLLIVLQIVPAPLFAAGTPAGGVAATLGQVNSVLATGGEAMGAIQNSQFQMQNIVNQLSGLNGQMQGQGQQLSAFQQIAQKIEAARVEAGSCISNATPKTSQYKKATIAAKDLEQTTISCSNYGNMIDSIRKNEAELRATHTKMSCVYDFQNKVNNIATESKAVFNQLNQAAMKVWNTHDSVIKAQDNIVKKIETELYDEKTGYRVRLAKLKETETKIRNALNAANGKGEKGESQSGILAQLRNIKQQRNATASAWYFNLMGETESCFASTPMPCDTLGNLATTRQCISSYLGQGQSGGPASKVVSNINNQRLGTAYEAIRESVRTTDMVLENVDIKSPDEFLAHAKKRFSNKMLAITRSIKNMKTMGSVNTSALVSLARKNYEACYKEKVAEFKGDIESASGGKYRQGINAMVEQEAGLANEIKNLTEEAQREMTSFKTAFNKTYNRDLSQFTSDCTSENDPYSSADCLKKIQLMLKAGIDGTIEKGQYQSSYVPEIITFDLQSISNQNGNITVVNKASSCQGFEECLVSMENSMAHYKSQKDSQVMEREQFVKKHNEDIAAAVGTAAQAFGGASDIFTNAASSINKELTDGGVLGAQVKLKSIEGEALAPDDKMEEPKLTGVPKDMKAAYAGMGKYNEIDGDDVTGPLNKRKEKLQELSKDAAKMKGKCAIGATDFGDVQRRLNCDEKKVCGDANIRSSFGAFEKLLSKSTNAGYDKENPEGLASDSFAKCVKDARRGKYDDEESDAPRRFERDGKIVYEDEGSFDKRQKLKQGRANEEKEDCKVDFKNDIEKPEPRGALKPAIAKIRSSLVNMADACASTSSSTTEEETDRSEAVEACLAVKSALRSAKAPDEGESPDTAEAPTNNATPNPISGTKSGF